MALVFTEKEQQLDKTLMRELHKPMSIFLTKDFPK
jgi:hypothetical protein